MNWEMFYLVCFGVGLALTAVSLCGHPTMASAAPSRTNAPGVTSGSTTLTR